MPEGDTLTRTAATLQRWLGGREVTEATTAVPGLAAQRMVGQRVEAVEAWGSHLLVRFASGQVLHSHLRMSGSWHAYSAGDVWRRPQRQARLVLTCGEHIAVCFNAPVVELLAARAEQVHPALSGAAEAEPQQERGVHGSEGERCPRCGTPVEAGQEGQGGAVSWCPKCQPGGVGTAVPPGP